MPLGFHVSVYRQQNDGTQAANSKTKPGTRLAVWQTDPWGIAWLDELAKTNLRTKQSSWAATAILSDIPL